MSKFSLLVKVLIYNQSQDKVFLRKSQSSGQWTLISQELATRQSIMETAKTAAEKASGLAVREVKLIKTEDNLIKATAEHQINFNCLAIVETDKSAQGQWFNLSEAIKQANLCSSTILLIEKLIKEKQLKSAEDFSAKYKRALADYQNLIKKNDQDKKEFLKFALTDFLQELLPIYDHLKLSLAGLPSTEKDNAWVVGVAHILRQFKELLNSKGVKEINTVGHKFNHNLMEAIKGEGELVVKEISPGYTLKDRLLRPAKVIVAKEKRK